LKDTKETPLMKQYKAIKVKYPGALLLFRVGDFYETFGEDAITASRILNITLTKRANGAASEVALAGFPFHALDTYLPKLVRAGQRVAICDQLEDPKAAQGIVKRGVTELVTPGVSLNDHVLDVKKNNWLAGVYFGEKNNGIAFLDISTGEFYAANGTAEYVDKLLATFGASEVIYGKQQKQNISALADQYNLFGLDDWVFQYEFAYEKLTQHFETTNLKGFGIEDMPEGIIAAGAIIHYLLETEHRNIKHISAISRIAEEQYVWLDKFTIRNLELLNAQLEGGVPLVDVLDRTVTPMGSREIRKWIMLPLKDKSRIEERLGHVTHLVTHRELIDSIHAAMKNMGDLERLVSKIATRRINPRELSHLQRCLTAADGLKQLLIEEPNLPLLRIADQINPCLSLSKRIEATLLEDCPAQSNQGNLIRKGVHAELDELRKIAFEGKDYLLQIQQREAQQTSIPSLKISYNKVFGYYLEVTNAHKDKVPADWIRKQTLTNAERYVTPELKVYEEKILNAEERLIDIERQLFDELVLEAAEYVPQLLGTAKALAILDVLCSLALVAIQNNYCRPEILIENVLDIKSGRHPVIEQQLPLGEAYVPNDIYLDGTDTQIAIITGPNMAGKSALLRQTALIVIMAQMGSYVPAAAARIGLVDKVFTRVGASDNLSKGESTFMVEMTETASILNNLSPQSLVLMDEIGRGTSTYDGISIAWAIVEYLHDHPKCKARTLFATHYHELNQLTERLPRVKNFNVSVKESGNKILFLRKLKPGGSNHSFGIHVAQMAGMPVSAVLRANEIMHHLEKNRDKVKDKESMKIPKAGIQLSLFEPPDPNVEKVKELVKQIDINATSPVEALLKLQEIKLLLSASNR
jgi:DNA mismatch repair protein MutS